MIKTSDYWLWAYFSFGSMALYSLWYVTLWFWPADGYSQTAADFWLREFKMKDLVTRGEPPPLARNIRFFRTISISIGLSIFFLIILITSLIREETRFLVLFLVATSLPFICTRFTYTKNPPLARFIPLLWGLLIGGVTLLKFLNLHQPWEVNLAGLSPTSLSSKGELVGALFFSLCGLIAFATKRMEKATEGMNKVQWLGWCVAAMGFGTVWVTVGLAWCLFSKS